MTKRIIALILACITALCLCGSAFADIIWTPIDKYYMENYDECDYLGRSYILNGESGSVTVRTSPNGKTTVAVLPNGCEMYVSFTTSDNKGELWGVIQFSYDENNEPVQSYDWSEDEEGVYSGWVPMDSLVLVYDYESFYEEHSGEFYSFEGNANDYAGMDLVAWNYPGGEPNESTMHVYEYTGDGMELVFTDCWTDENGLEWAAIGYYYGWRRIWVCLSDPENRDLQHVERGEHTDLIAPDKGSVKTPDAVGNTKIYLAALALGVVFAALCVIIYTLGKKNRA